MDRAAISDLRRGKDQSQGEGSSEGNTKAAFPFVLATCLASSSLIIFSIWKCVFAMSVLSKTLLTVQRPKESTTSDSWLLFLLSVSLVAFSCQLLIVICRSSCELTVGLNFMDFN